MTFGVRVLVCPMPQVSDLRVGERGISAVVGGKTILIKVSGSEVRHLAPIVDILRESVQLGDLLCNDGMFSQGLIKMLRAGLVCLKLSTGNQSLTVETNSHHLATVTKSTVPGPLRWAAETFFRHIDGHWIVKNPHSCLVLTTTTAAWLASHSEGNVLLGGSGGFPNRTLAAVTRLLLTNGILEEDGTGVERSGSTLVFYSAAYHRASTSDSWQHRIESTNTTRMGDLRASAALDEESTRRQGAALQLPPTQGLSETTVEAALRSRRSIRSSLDPQMALSLAVISTLLHFTFSNLRTSRSDHNEVRAIPSAGAMYTLRPFLLVVEHDEIADGLYAYDSEQNRLTLTNFSRAAALRTLLAGALGSKVPPTLVVLLFSDLGESQRKYGTKSLYFSHVEVGCTYEAFHILCASMGVGGCAIGTLHGEVLDYDVIERVDVVCGFDHLIIVGAFALFGGNSK